MLSAIAALLHLGCIFSGGEECPDLAANKYLCMSAARLAGLEVPEFWLSNDRRLFVMRRFDVSRKELCLKDVASFGHSLRLSETCSIFRT
nr:HipA domain-containing protein [Verrucomicrobium sp. 3C]